MAIFIALDASADDCSVTLVRDNLRIGKTSSVPRSHARVLLPYVDELLSSQGLTPRDLDFVACCQGPGSFTGLRIGLGVAQGIAFATGKPMVGVTSLEAMAWTAKKICANHSRVFCLLDARMNEIYWAAYEFFGEFPRIQAGPNLSPVSELNEILIGDLGGGELLLAGRAVHLLNPSVTEHSSASVDMHVSPNSDAIADLAYRRWCAGEFCEAKDFQLTYLRNSVSWNKRQRIRS